MWMRDLWKYSAFQNQLNVNFALLFLHWQSCRCCCGRSNIDWKMLCTQNAAATSAFSNIASDNRARNIDTSIATESITSTSGRYVLALGSKLGALLGIIVYFCMHAILFILCLRSHPSTIQSPSTGPSGCVWKYWSMQTNSDALLHDDIMIVFAFSILQLKASGDARISVHVYHCSRSIRVRR